MEVFVGKIGKGEKVLSGSAEKGIVWGKKPHEGMVIYNAPRPLKGHEEWTADAMESPNGIYFAAVNPNEANASTLAENNLKHGAIEVEYKAEPSYENALKWWLSEPKNKEPNTQKRKDRLIKKYKGAILSGQVETPQPPDWDKLKLGRKVAIVTDARWVTNKGKLSKLGEKIAESKWGDLSPAAQNIIKRKEGMA